MLKLGPWSTAPALPTNGATVYTSNKADVYSTQMNVCKKKSFSDEFFNMKYYGNVMDVFRFIMK